MVLRAAALLPRSSLSCRSRSLIPHFGLLVLPCLLFALVAPAAAQSSGSRWLFVPALSGPPPSEVSISQLTNPFEIELRSTNQAAISNSDAAQLFESRHSSEPVKLNTDEMSKLLHSVGLAARHLALGELPQAQQAMEGVYALSGPARDYLNREAARARKIFDTCLMTAYLWERDHKRQQALRQMLECSRNFPGFRPEGRAYPPELRAVFEQAKVQLSQEAATTLLIQSRHSSGCSVRLNGIEVGKSPINFSDVRAGVMRVQLECRPGVEGRIHSIELKPGENRVEIDPAFDAAVHSHGGLWLQYSSSAVRDARMDKDLEQIAKAVGNVRVVGLVVEGGRYPRVRVRSLTTPPRNVASLSYGIGEGYSPEALTAALKALRPQVKRRVNAQGQYASAPVQLAAPPTPALVAEEPSPASVPEGPVEQQNVVAGALLAGTGLSGIAVGWVLYTLRAGQLQQRWDDVVSMNPADTQPANEVLPAAPVATVAGGALLLTISDYFWPPDDDGVPPWAWVVGGLGAAIVGTGIAIAVATADCANADPATLSNEPTVCLQYWTDPAGIFGPIIAMHGVPLLSIPIAYAIRAAVRPGDAETQTTFNLTTLPGGGAVLQLRGKF